jgi:hypothetical protein
MTEDGLSIESKRAQQFRRFLARTPEAPYGVSFYATTASVIHANCPTDQASRVLNTQWMQGCEQERRLARRVQLLCDSAGVRPARAYVFT